MKLLFVCNQNKNRSKTAQELFSVEYETRSVGLYGGTLITETDLTWADIVFVMEDAQREAIGKKFPKAYLSKRIMSLAIPDIYIYGQDQLRLILKQNFNSLKPFL